MRKGSIAVTIFLFLLAGCSTVDKRMYFSPMADLQSLRGPAEPSCGWTNFGGLPDTYVFNVDDKEFRIQAHQNIHPYLWGPWFASVVPVFPITWTVELFVSDELTIRMYGDKEALSKLSKEDVSITYSSANDRIRPMSVKFNGYNTTIVFSLDYNYVDTFVLKVVGLGMEKREINVPFIKTNRWTWTQWTPNC